MSPRAAWRLESLGFPEVYDYEGGKMDWLAAGLPSEGAQRRLPLAADVARHDAPTCRLGERVGIARQLMRRGGWSQCLVLNEAGVVLGRIRRGKLGGADDQRVEEVMEEGPSTYRPSVPVAELVETLRRGRHATAVISDSDGVFLGLLSRRDAEEALRKARATGSR